MMKLNDVITIIAIALMIGSILVGIQYYYNIGEQDCRGSPLTYGARQLEESYGYPFVGYGYFIGSDLNSPIVSFNSSYYNIDNP